MHCYTLRRLAAFGLRAIATALPLAAASTDEKPFDVRVVVVTTFEVGKDTGDVAGELQNWIERYPCNEELPFAQGIHKLMLNRKDHVLCLLTGVGKSHASASVMGLGMDPRFDLTKAYWILAGIGGIDPRVAPVASGVWANYVVDGDLAYELDGRDIPASFSTGIIPYDRSTPFEKPAPPRDSDNGVLSYHLNEQLTDWAYKLTREVKLDDDAHMQAARAGYAGIPGGARPPYVLKGDTLTADRFWLGEPMTAWAEKWVPYWTEGKGSFATSAEEDSGYMQALSMLAGTGRIRLDRAMDLRTASDFTFAPKGESSAEFLKSEATGNYAAFSESIENAYRLGSVVVRELSGHWDKYADALPKAQ